MADVIRPSRRRFWLLPLIAVVVLAAAPRGARNPAPLPKPQAESYPATRFGPAATGEVEHRLMSLAPQRPKDGLPGLGLGETDWHASGGHPYLDSALPGVEFLLAKTLDSRVSCGGPGSEVSPIYDILAVRDGKLYGLRRLNQLLLDAGFPFDSASAPTAAKIAVLFSLLGDQFTYTLTPRPQFNRREYRVPDIDSAQAFPAVEFRRVERDTWLHPKHKDTRYGVSLDCVIDGKPVKLHLEFDWPGSPSQAQVLYSGDAEPKHMEWFDWIWLPQRDSSESGGWVPADDSQWLLACVGDWTEVDDSSRTHYFSLVKVNDSLTHHFITFFVFGVSGDSAFFRFRRKQDGHVSWCAKETTQTGEATLVWNPTYDSTAEYSVTAHNVRNGQQMSDPVLVDPEAWVGAGVRLIGEVLQTDLHEVQRRSSRIAGCPTERGRADGRPTGCVGRGPSFMALNTRHHRLLRAD